MILTDHKCQEKKEEDDSPALNVALMYQKDDSKNIFKKIKETQTPVTRKRTDFIMTDRTTKKKMERKTTVWIYLVKWR